MQRTIVPASNCKVKHYPGGYCEASIFNYQAFGKGKKEDKGIEKKVPVGNQIGFADLNEKYLQPDRKVKGKKKQRSRDDSIQRSKNKIFDIAISNEWDWFFTLTLDPAKLDRYDPVVVCKAFKKWLSNMQQRNHLQYLFVPEFHENGELDDQGRKGIHFHGLVKGDFDFVESGRFTKDGKTIFNVKNWRYGFTTAIRLTGPRIAVAKYITKYVTKEMKGALPSMYYAGGGVVRDVPVTYHFVPFGDVPVDAIPINVPAAEGHRLAVKYFKYNDQDEDFPCLVCQINLSNILSRIHIL